MLQIIIQKFIGTNIYGRTNKNKINWKLCSYYMQHEKNINERLGKSKNKINLFSLKTLIRRKHQVIFYQILMHIKRIEKIILCLNYLTKGKGALDNFLTVMSTWYLVKPWYNTCLKSCLTMTRRTIVTWSFTKHFIGSFDTSYSSFRSYGFPRTFSFVMQNKGNLFVLLNPFLFET